MRTALDTNILSALWSSEPLAAKVSQKLAELHSEGGLVVCGAVFVELFAHPSVSSEFVEQFLADTEISVDFDLEEEVWRIAAKGFAAYARRRRRSAGGAARRLPVDFLIAAHASLRADRLMTLDASRYKHDFPGLRVFAV